jgi:hypothetical protein
MDLDTPELPYQMGCDIYVGKIKFYRWKMLFLTVTIIILTNLSFTQNQYNFQDTIYIENLHGNVKSIYVSVYSAKEYFGEVKQDKLEQSFKLFFNEKGLLIKRINYTNNGQIKYSVIPVYNSEDLLIEQTTKNPQGLITRKIRYTYNEFGDRAVETLYKKNGEVEKKYTYNYDYDSLIVQKIEYGSYGENEKLAKTYNFDSIGNIYYDIFQDKFNDLDVNYYEYDSSRNISKLWWNDFEFHRIESSIFKYDSHDNFIERIKYFSLNEEVLGAVYEKTIRKIEYYD